jgi:hypothetical protein
MKQVRNDAGNWQSPSKSRCTNIEKRIAGNYFKTDKQMSFTECIWCQMLLSLSIDDEPHTECSMANGNQQQHLTSQQIYPSYYNLPIMQ